MSEVPTSSTEGTKALDDNISYTSYKESLTLLSNETNKHGCKSRLMRSFTNCILSECMNELAILNSITQRSEQQSDVDRCPKYKSIEERYMGQENHADVRIGSEIDDLDKLAKDISSVYGIVEDLQREVDSYGTFEGLKVSIDVMRKMRREEDQLLLDEENQEKIIDDIKLTCEEERLENIQTIEDTNANIQRLRFESEDVYLYGQREVAYFEQWERARLEQNKIQCDEKERHFSNIIKDTNEKMNLETRCHKEFIAYLEESKSDLLEEIQTWMKRYDEDFEKRESDIINLKPELEKIKDERKIVEEKYKERIAAIEDFLEYKRIEEEKAEQRQKEFEAALKIQAWWRGVMVRKKLGPFRKKKKRKEQGAEKKKKKK